MLTTKTKLIGMTLCAASLSACSSFYSTSATSYHPTTTHRDAEVQLYPDGYDNGGAYAPTDATTVKKDIVVPDTYHTNAYQAPTSFKDRDNSWVGHQNPQGYTIELANGDKAADVAGVLQKAPKNERMAEIKYRQDGKEYYKGVYGSYPSYQAAQQALSALPEDVRQGAGVKTWGSVQSSVSQ
jgi:septal ring-binding cell division protein DamX